MVDADGTFEKGPVRIMDSWDQVFRGNTVRLVKCCDGTEEWKRQHGEAKTLCVPIILSCLMMKVCF